MKRKTTIHLMRVYSTALVLSLSSCVSITDVVSDDVYVMKGSSIPISESLTDETSYSTFRYKKERNNRVDYYVDNRSIFGRYGRYNSPYIGFNYNSRYNMGPYFRDTHFGHHGGGLMYIPGMGWTFSGGHMNPYGVYGHPHQMYGYWGYYSGFYQSPIMCYDPYSIWNSWSDNHIWGNTNGTMYGNHFSGPRGSVGGSGVMVRNGAYVGTVKSGESVGGSINNLNQIPTNFSRKPVGRGETGKLINNENNYGTVDRTKLKKTEVYRIPTRQDTFKRPREVNTTPPDNRDRRVNNESNSRVTTPLRNSGGGLPITTPSRNSSERVSTPSRNSGNVTTVSKPLRGSSGSSGGYRR
jgi:hypothetical protein